MVRPSHGEILSPGIWCRCQHSRGGSDLRFPLSARDPLYTRNFSLGWSGTQRTSVPILHAPSPRGHETGRTPPPCVVELLLPIHIVLDVLCQFPGIVLKHVLGSRVSAPVCLSLCASSSFLAPAPMRHLQPPLCVTLTARMYTLYAQLGRADGKMILSHYPGICSRRRKAACDGHGFKADNCWKEHGKYYQVS